MDKLSRDNTLLALLLALRNLDAAPSLSRSEWAKLYEVGEQLELDPDDWEFIGEGLTAIIEGSPSLNQLFSAVKTQLDVVDIEQLLPQPDELAVALGTRKIIEGRGERRGYGDGKEDSSPGIVKITRKLLKDADPVGRAKQLSWLDRVVKSINF